MDNESIAKVDQLIVKLNDFPGLWKVREAANSIMQIILDNFYGSGNERAVFEEALASVLKQSHECKSHDCGCPDCPNSFYNYEAVIAEGFDVNSEVKVEVKKEVPTASSEAYVPSTTDLIWRKAVLEEFRKSDKYGSMPLPTLVSMVLASRNAQPSNYSKMEASLRNYLHTPDGEATFTITRGRGGGVKVKYAWRDETWQ